MEAVFLPCFFFRFLLLLTITIQFLQLYNLTTAARARYYTTNHTLHTLASEYDLAVNPDVYVPIHGLKHVLVDSHKPTTSTHGKNNGFNKKKPKLNSPQTSVSRQDCLPTTNSILHKFFSKRHIPLTRRNRKPKSKPCYNRMISDMRAAGSYDTEEVSKMSELAAEERLKRSPSQNPGDHTKMDKKTNPVDPDIWPSGTLSINKSKKEKTKKSSFQLPSRATKVSKADPSGRRRRRKRIKPTAAGIAPYVQKPLRPKVSKSSPTVTTTTTAAALSETTSGKVKSVITPTPVVSPTGTTSGSNSATPRASLHHPHPHQSSSVPKILHSTAPLAGSPVVTSPGTVAGLSSRQEAASKSSLYIHASSTSSSSSLLSLQSSPSSSSQSSPSSLPSASSLLLLSTSQSRLPTVVVTPPVHSSQPHDTFTKIPATSSLGFQPSTATPHHHLHPSSEGPVLTKMPTPFMTLQLKNVTSTEPPPVKGGPSTHIPQLSPSLTLAPTLTARPEKNTPALSNHLPTIATSLPTSSIIVLLNNSLLATRATKWRPPPATPTTTKTPTPVPPNTPTIAPTAVLSSDHNMMSPTRNKLPVDTSTMKVLPRKSMMVTSSKSEDTTLRFNPPASASVSASASLYPPTSLLPTLYKTFTLPSNTVPGNRQSTGTERTTSRVSKTTKSGHQTFIYAITTQATPGRSRNSSSSSSSNNSSNSSSSSKKTTLSTVTSTIGRRYRTSMTTTTTTTTKTTKLTTTTFATIFKPLITSTPKPAPTNFSVTKFLVSQKSYMLVPDWKVAKQEWKAAWHVHIYTFGSLFAVLAVYLLICMLLARRTLHLLSTCYFVVVNGFLFLFCVLRALFLLVDGYNSNQSYPYLVGFLLFYMAFPCLTSSFSLTFYSFLKTAKVQYLSSKFQCLPLLITVIVLHYLLPTTAAVFIGLSLNAKTVLFVSQIFFVIWGLFLFLGYIFVYKRLQFAAKKRQKLLLQLREAKIHMNNYTIYKERLTFCLGVNVALCSSVIGMFCSCLQVYSALYFLEIFPNELPRAWPWWGYQTAVRFFEFLLCIMLSYVTTLPFKHRSKYGFDPWFYCASCTWMCSRDKAWNAHKDVSWSNMDDNMSSIGISKETRRKEIKAAGYEIIPLTISLSQDSENLPLDTNEPDSMLIVQNGFVRFRTNEELEELRQSPKVPKMHAVTQKAVSIPKVPKTLQWGNNSSCNSSKGLQNNGYHQSKDTLLENNSSPECLSSSTSPPSSQFNRVSTAGSEFTFRAPSLSLASSIDKELENFFRHSSHRSLSSVTSTDVLAIDEDASSDNSVFQPDDNAAAERKTGDDHTKDTKDTTTTSFFLTEDPEDS